jgi:excisionase family DNA binding protein
MPPYEHDELRGALTIDSFCQTYRLGRTFVYKLIKDRKLRAVKCGTRTLILQHDAETWARSLPEMGGAK